MTKETMCSLEQLNKLSLDAIEEKAILDFFSAVEKNEEKLSAFNTDGLEVLVHLSELSKLYNVLRDDVASKEYTREQLQEQAPESYDGYWQVPRLVD